MIIDCISDLHGEMPKLTGGDILIVAGDLTARDTALQHAIFSNWVDLQNYEMKIVIAGNHDGHIEKNGFLKNINDFKPTVYLEDSLIEYKGLKIWGSPWTPTFCNWYFMKDRGQPIKEKWDLIPGDIDILITHGPPLGILDKVALSSRGIQYGEYRFAGCEDLLEAVKRVKPKLHVFGHIHESYGEYRDQETIYVNACIMNENYSPVNAPIRIIL